MSGDVFPNIQRKYGLRTRELGKTVLKGFLVALKIRTHIIILLVGLYYS